MNKEHYQMIFDYELPIGPRTTEKTQKSIQQHDSVVADEATIASQHATMASEAGAPVDPLTQHCG